MKQEVLDLITEFGGIDGEHHKQWVLDQIVRLLTDCPMVPMEGISNGLTFQYEVRGKSDEYKKWIRDYCNGEDGPETYSWDEGIAP